MSAIKYRPAIDGMRSIAVISVLLFHLNPDLLPGGFVGVDIFFVISGYLITTIIATECQTDTFSFRRFYQRRIARIFPPAFLVLIVVLALACVFYTAQDLANAGDITIAAALSFANMKLMIEGNYFEILPDAQPLLHYWSLSVEEQFYILFPIIVYAAFRLRLSRYLFAALLTALAINSFISGIMLAATQPTWAFYLLPTRVWELLAGCILAIVSIQNPKNSPGKTDAILANIGLVLIVMSFFVIHENDFFPGWIAAIPVMGTVLLIGHAHHPQQGTERLLSHPWLVYVGKTSYSLYLWHWPIYCFVDYTMFAYTHWQRTALKIILTLACSFTSYNIFEKPLRAWLNQPRRQSLGFIGFTCGVVTLVAIGFLIKTRNSIDTYPNNTNHRGITFNADITEPVVLLMGDSNAAMYGLLMKNLAHEMQFRLHVISAIAQNPFSDSPLYRNTMDYLKRETPHIVIFVTAWAQSMENDKTPLTTTITQIQKYADHIILITQPPVLPQHASRQGIRENGPGPIFEDAFIANLRHQTNNYLLSLQNENVHVLNIESQFVKSNGAIRFTNTNRKLLFQDQGHLSGVGSQLIRDLMHNTLTQIIGNISTQSKPN